MSVDLESPLGFATFVANASNHRKVFVPSTFNMTSILKSVARQESHDIVCDQDFYELEAPEATAVEYKERCTSVKSAIVGGKGSVSSSIFKADSAVIDPYTL